MLATGTLSSPLATPEGTQLYLGDFVSTMGSFEGLLDDVAVFDHALGAEQVGRLAAGGSIGVFFDGFESGDTCAWSNGCP